MSNQTFHTALPALDLTTDNEEAKKLLEQSQQMYGMIPNMFANMANLPGLLETYMLGFGKIYQQSGFTPTEIDVLFLTISRENECRYCTAAHSFSGDMMSQVPKEVTDSIRDKKEITDAKLKALSEFALVMMHKHGSPSDADVAKFLAAGYTEKQILAVILAIAIKTISNYSNHIFHTTLEPMMASRTWAPVK